MKLTPIFKFKKRELTDVPDISATEDNWDNLETVLLKNSNKNLLDNPWFTVNQRKVTSWSNWSYGVDRWIVNSSTATVNSDGTITIPPGGEIYNKFEIGDFIGKEVTVSILFSDGRILSKHGIVEDSSVWKLLMLVEDENLHGVRLNVEDGGQLLTVAVVCSSGSTKSLTVRAVKLELGSVSTLKNDIAPDYTTELLKCQRYYQTGSIHTTGFTIAGVYAVNVFLKQNMRVVPGIGITECAYWNGSAWIPVGYDIVDQLGDTGYFSCWVNSLPTNTQINIIIRYFASADL